MDFATGEEAINTALEYETKGVGVYAEAVASTNDSRGRRVLQVLAGEEKDHVAYLERVLARWKDTGEVAAESLDTAIPSEETIRKGIGKLNAQMADEDRPVTAEAELELLSKALAVETSTSAFYRGVVGELDERGRQLFSRFAQVEEGHRVIVQAEIDSVTGTGYWFDFREFDLEAA